MNVLIFIYRASSQHPTFILQVTGCIQQLILKRSLAHYGGDSVLANIGIIMSVILFLVMPAMESDKALSLLSALIMV